MKKVWIVGVVVIIVVILVAGFVYVNTTLVSDDEVLENEVMNTSSELSEYFGDRMVTLGVLDVGHPIEGFDAGLLMKAFPGLRSKDFEGVDAVGGHYELENGSQTFVSATDASVSSARGTVKNYEELFDNLVKRIDVRVRNKKDVDAIIVRLNSAEHIRTKIDRGAMAFGIKIIPQALVEDSRCPADVQCIQAGTVKVSALVEVGTSTENKIFGLRQHKIIDEKAVTLQRVLPERRSGQTIKPSEYQFIFWIQKGVTEK